MKKQLIVIVPGSDGKLAPWKAFLEQLAQEPKLHNDSVQTSVEVYPEPKIRRLGLQPLKIKTNDLAAWISNKSRLNQYDEIILIGHSAGGILVRQAYLDGIEQNHTWVTKVSRIVLFASSNRGVVLPCYLKIADFFLRLFFFYIPFTYQDLLRGSAFVANLRIAWIRHFNSGTGKLPKVVQVLGTKDKKVKTEDSHDVLAFPQAAYVQVAGENHTDLPRLKTGRSANGQRELKESGRSRYELLLSTIIGDEAEMGLIKSGTPVSEAKYDRYVFILHGIRAWSVDEWLEKLEERINQSDPRTHAVRAEYGYFSALRFVLPSLRRRYVRWFQDAYTEHLAKNPNAKFSLISHSNGTYILGQSLKALPSMNFERVVLAGSVLPTDFFDVGREVCGQIGEIRSDGARYDWPVGILCRVLRTFFMHDVGTGGYEAFRGYVVKNYIWQSGGHGGMFYDENIKSMASFILTGKSEPAPLCAQKSAWFHLLSRASPFIAGVCLLGILALPFLAQIPVLLYYGTVLLGLILIAMFLEIF